MAKPKKADIDDGRFEQLEKTLAEIVEESLDDPDDFAEFESTLLDLTNELARRIEKKRSKR